MSAHHQPLHGRQPRGAGLLLTVEQVAELWFGEVGDGGSASSNCQRIRRLIATTLPARRIGNRWYIHRTTAESWAAGSDPASVMAHPDTTAVS
ncbi:MAG TPA: helix-turn-helix domain-containing protein, partial [Pseudonocardiaceae bacterium]|nr:helix-turn-helix domain-containing protein [Pseudonocardiaceae bacterium]